MDLDRLSTGTGNLSLEKDLRMAERQTTGLAGSSAVPHKVLLRNATDADSIHGMTKFAFLTFSLPRVINFKFPLQPHQKYNITQYYEERGFS